MNFTDAPPVTLSGLDASNDAVPGHQITATVNDPDAGSDITYIWTVGGQTVNADNPGIGNTFTPTAAEAGLAVSVSATLSENDDVETGVASAGVVVTPPVVSFEAAPKAKPSRSRRTTCITSSSRT